MYNRTRSKSLSYAIGALALAKQNPDEKIRLCFATDEALRINEDFIVSLNGFIPDNMKLVNVTKSNPIATN